ncbi:hypothetical protein KQI10_10120 [Pseudoflavonifractor sp. MSJ-30]|nr:hypothetical protein [Pseudoflavonifractor sp. MSJ-30]
MAGGFLRSFSVSLYEQAIDAYSARFENLPFINDIVKNAVLLDSFGLKNGKSPNSLLMHSLYAVADVGNGQEVAKLLVEEMNDPSSGTTKKRSYQPQNIEKAFAASVRVQGKAPSSVTNTANAVRTIAVLFSNVKQKDRPVYSNTSDASISGPISGRTSKKSMRCSRAYRWA